MLTLASKDLGRVLLLGLLLVGCHPGSEGDSDGPAPPVAEARSPSAAPPVAPARSPPSAYSVPRHIPLSPGSTGDLWVHPTGDTAALERRRRNPRWDNPEQAMASRPFPPYLFVSRELVGARALPPSCAPAEAHPASFIAWRPDGGVVCLDAEGLVRGVPGEHRVSALAITRAPIKATLSPDGTALAFAVWLEGPGGDAGNDDRSLHVGARASSETGASTSRTYESWSRQGDRLAVLEGPWIFPRPPEIQWKAVGIEDAASGDLLARREGFAGPVVFSPDGAWLAARRYRGVDAGAVVVLDARDPELALHVELRDARTQGDSVVWCETGCCLWLRTPAPDDPAASLVCRHDLSETGESKVGRCLPDTRARHGVHGAGGARLWVVVKDEPPARPADRTPTMFGGPDPSEHLLVYDDLAALEAGACEAYPRPR